MRFTSSPRRALGIFAVSTIGMSTAVLGVTGVAQATGPAALTASTPLTIPSGVCTVEWVPTAPAVAGSRRPRRWCRVRPRVIGTRASGPVHTLTAGPVTLPGGAAEPVAGPAAAASA